ncbi:hypothetical protein KXV85_002670, partial [Aspergillus fumigatus]
RSHHLFHRPQAGRRHQGARQLRRAHVHDRQPGDGREGFRRCRLRRGGLARHPDGPEIFAPAFRQACRLFRARPGRPGGRRGDQKQDGAGPLRARAVSQGLRLGHRHLVLPDRGRGQRGRPRSLDLGHLLAYRRQDRRPLQWRPRQRALFPLQGGRAVDQAARCQG